jgi:hypothetical protein
MFADLLEVEEFSSAETLNEPFPLPLPPVSVSHEADSVAFQEVLEETFTLFEPPS